MKLKWKIQKSKIKKMSILAHIKRDCRKSRFIKERRRPLKKFEKKCNFYRETFYIL